MVQQNASRDNPVLGTSSSCEDITWCNWPYQPSSETVPAPRVHVSSEWQKSVKRDMLAWSKWFMCEGT